MATKTQNAFSTKKLSELATRPIIKTDAVYDIDISKLSFKVISDELVVLDETKACAYIDLPIFRGEREVKDSHVQKLYDEMRKGMFNPMLVILATAEFEGTVYKLNGQHTCWAKFNYPGYEPTVREVKFKVQTSEQLRQLYSTFDRNLARSDNHITLVELSNNPHLQSYSSTAIQFLSSGMKVWLTKDRFERQRYTPQTLAAIIAGEHLNLFRAVADFFQQYVLNDKSAGHMRRAPVCAAVFETFSRNVQRGSEFWSTVANGVGLLSKTDARYQLRNFLMNAKLNTTVKRGTRSVSEEQLYNHCVPAFNKWRRGEEVKVLAPTQQRVRAI